MRIKVESKVIEMGNVAYDKSFAYAVKILTLSEGLTNKHKYELASQVIRSGTSIGANIAESEYAQSGGDFVSKMSIALKEASESRYWIRLLRASGNISEETSKQLLRDIDEIIRILAASVKTAKQK